MKCSIKLKKGNIPDKLFKRKSLIKGIKVESEHSDLLCIKKQIAKAHLIENPKYYSDVKGKGIEKLITVKNGRN